MLTTAQRSMKTEKKMITKKTFQRQKIYWKKEIRLLKAFSKIRNYSLISSKILSLLKKIKKKNKKVKIKKDYFRVALEVKVFFLVISSKKNQGKKLLKLLLNRTLLKFQDHQEKLELKIMETPKVIKSLFMNEI